MNIIINCIYIYTYSRCKHIHLSGKSMTDCCYCTAAGVATVSATAVVLLVFTNAVSVVTTFLCTRRCYRQSSNARPPSPEEKGAYHDDVMLDSVQMQSSPAYASVAEEECDCV